MKIQENPRQIDEASFCFAQIVNMNSTNIQQLLTFIEHTSNIHPIPDNLYQTEKIFKLLMLTEELYMTKINVEIVAKCEQNRDGNDKKGVELNADLNQ